MCLVSAAGRFACETGQPIHRVQLEKLIGTDHHMNPQYPKLEIEI